MSQNHHRKPPIPTQAIIKLLSLLPNFDKRRARRVCNRWMIQISKKFDQMRQLMWPMDAENSSLLMKSSPSRQHGHYGLEETTTDATSTPFGNLSGPSQTYSRRRFMTPSELSQYLHPPNWSEDYNHNSSYLRNFDGFRDLSEISRRMAKSRRRSNPNFRHCQDDRKCCSYDSFHSDVAEHSNKLNKPHCAVPNHSEELVGCSTSTHSSQLSPVPHCRNNTENSTLNYIILPQETQRDRLIRYSPSDQSVHRVTTAGKVISGTTQKEDPFLLQHIFPPQSVPPQPVLLKDSFPIEQIKNSAASDSQYGTTSAEIVDTLAIDLIHPDPIQYVQQPYELTHKQSKSISEISMARKFHSASSESIQEYFYNFTARSEDNLQTKVGGREYKNYDSKGQSAKYPSQSNLEQIRFGGSQSHHLHSKDKKHSPLRHQNYNEHDYAYLRRVKMNKNKNKEGLSSYKSHPYGSGHEERPTSSYRSQQRSTRHEKFQEPGPNIPSSVPRSHKVFSNRDGEGSEFSRPDPHPQQQYEFRSKHKHRGPVAHQLHFHKRPPSFNQVDIEKLLERRGAPSLSSNNHDDHTDNRSSSQKIKYHHLKAKKDEYTRLGHKSKKIVVTKRKAKKIVKNG